MASWTDYAKAFCSALDKEAQRQKAYQEKTPEEKYWYIKNQNERECAKGNRTTLGIILDCIGQNHLREEAEKSMSQNEVNDFHKRIDSDMESKKRELEERKEYNRQHGLYKEEPSSSSFCNIC